MAPVIQTQWGERTQETAFEEAGRAFPCKRQTMKEKESYYASE